MAVSRSALIITNPGEVGSEGYCEGVNKDAQLYRSFLLSPVGGAWRSSELSTLKQPSRQEVRDAVSAIAGADYSLVAFCGHGYYSASKDSTILELRKGIELDSVELRQGATKRTIVLDCCRKVHRPMALDEAMRKSIAKADAVVDPKESRKYYDKSIADCSDGIVVLFGCSIGETAGDDAQRGGFYSYNLVESTRDWARDNDVDTATDYSVCSVVRAHAKALPRVTQLSGGTQTPTIQKPRSEPYFPFGIVA